MLRLARLSSDLTLLICLFRLQTFVSHLPMAGAVGLRGSQLSRARWLAPGWASYSGLVD